MDKRVGSEVSSLRRPTLQPNSATQWLKVGWPPQGGWPPGALWRAAGGMFVGFG